MTIETGERVFLDSNVLLSATDRSRPRHDEARELFQAAVDRGYTLALCGQIVREYLVVATRPVEVNGLGMRPADALRNVDSFAARAELCDETEAVSARLRRLTGAYGLSGKRIHDANVVATMGENGIEWLVTENAQDFEVFGEIKTVGLSSLRI